MEEITDRKSLQAWLETRPVEDARAIAARAALRALPALVTALDKDAEERRVTIVLPTLRAMAVASVAGKWPTQATEVRKADSAAAASAFSAAAAAARSAASAVSADSAASAASAAASAFSAASAARSAAFAAVNEDCQRLSRGLSNGDLGAQPLWPLGPPDWATEHWTRLRDHLLAADEGWEVWTTWYDALMKGGEMNEALEVAKALIPNKIWEAGPKVLNAEIARIIAKHADNITAPPDQTIEEPTVEEVPPVTLGQSDKSRLAKVIAARPMMVIANLSDLTDRVEQEITLRQAERRNDPDAQKNLEFLEGLGDRLADVTEEAKALPLDPTAEDAAPTAEKAWNLLDHAEKYCAWIAGTETARPIANGVLLGGIAIAGIQLGLAPLPVTAAVVAMIGGRALKAHLGDLIKHFRAGRIISNLR